MKTQITKPMLAVKCKDIETLDFANKEYYATPKLDGIRAIMVGGRLVSRQFKPIKNTHIRTLLESVLPEGADGEIVCPGAFQDTSSGVMSSDGTPEFIYYWFDYVKDDLEKPYVSRITDMLYHAGEMVGLPYSEKVHTLVPVRVKTLEELKAFEQKCIDDGFEGAILRTGDSPYKCGRATARSEWMLKIKRFEDSEAVILDFGEKMHNDNPAEKDAFGRTKRSSHQENKRPAGTLGFLVVKDINTGIEFEIGTGFDDELRQLIWDNRKTWKGKIIKYKHFAVSGVKDKPRFPVFLGERDPEDM